MSESLAFVTTVLTGCLQGRRWPTKNSKVVDILWTCGAKMIVQTGQQVVANI